MRYPLQARGAMGVVVTLTQEEHDLMYGKIEGQHKVSRKRCTFLPGVNAEYDAKVAVHEARMATRGAGKGILSDETKQKIREGMKRSRDFMNRSF